MSLEQLRGKLFYQGLLLGSVGTAHQRSIGAGGTGDRG